MSKTSNQNQKPKPVQKKAAPTKELYDEYVKFKLIELDGGKLKDEVKERLTKLEKEVMSCGGSKGRVTKTRAVGIHVIKIVEGVPLPDEYVKILKSQPNNKDCE